MEIVNIYEAKTRLSQILARVEAGEEVLIARAGKPIARLTRIDVSPDRRSLGEDDGRIVFADDFEAPLPDDVVAEFER